MKFAHILLPTMAILGTSAVPAFGQVINIETFGTGSYPGASLSGGQTSYIFNAPAQPANFPNILADGEYTIATDTQQGFSSWASIGDNTTGSGYMMLVNADANQAGEFYRAQVPLTANTTYDFLAYLVTVNSQGDFDYCTANEGGLILPNVTLQIEASATGTVLASVDTGDIPFNPVPVWDEYKLEFTTGASTSAVDVVLINNAPGGCGNDLAIDDITFRVSITMEASDDAITLTNTDMTQSAVLTLGSNDTLDGNMLPGTELYSVASGSSLPSGLTLNGSTGEVGVPAGTPSGTYSFDYQVCETVNEFNCAIATATITVALPPLPITTDDDNGTVADSSAGFTSVLNVLDNDSIDSVSSPSDFDLSIADGSSLPSGLTFNENTGEVGVLQGAPTGIYTFDYELCEQGDPTNCEIATVTIDVTNPAGGSFCPIGTAAFPGTYHVFEASGGQNPSFAEGAPITEGGTDTGGSSAVTYFGPITMELTDDDAVLVPEGEVIQIALSSAWGTSARAEIRMSSDGSNYTSLGTTGNGGSVYGAWQSNVFRYDDFTVPAGGARWLQVVQEASGVRADGVIYNTQCQPSATPPTISAVNESETVQGTASAQVNVLNVIDNDSFDGVTPTAFDLSVNSASSLPPELTFDTATGAVGVAAAAPAGVYSFDYDICEEGSTTNCETATVTITVEVLADIVAVAESFAPIDRVAGGVTTSVLASDTLNGAALDPADVTLTTGASDAELSLDPATGFITVAAGTAAGTYTAEYTICENLNPTNCETITETVTVSGSAPSLSMIKTADDPGPYTAGDIVNYTYTVTNDGDTVIRDVVVTDTHNGSDPAPVPSNETLLSDTGAAGDSTDAGSDGSWDVLGPGDAVTFTGSYTVTATDAATLRTPGT